LSAISKVNQKQYARTLALIFKVHMLMIHIYAQDESLIKILLSDRSRIFNQWIELICKHVGGITFKYLRMI